MLIYIFVRDNIKWINNYKLFKLIIKNIIFQIKYMINIHNIF